MNLLPYISIVFLLGAVVVLLRFLVRLYNRTGVQTINALQLSDMLTEAGIPAFRFIAVPYLKGGRYDINVVNEFIERNK